MENGELATPFLLLFNQLTMMSQAVHSGLFVASGDVLLHLPDTEYAWNDYGITGFAIPADTAYAPGHGVYQIENNSSRVQHFYQKPSIQMLEERNAILPDNTVYIDSGIVYFCAETAKKILSLNVLPPLDACTYLGVDNGAIPLRIELYTDILHCMVESTQKEEYLSIPSDAKDLAALQRARERLWETLRSTPFHAIAAKNGKFAHLGTTKEYIDLFVSDCEFHRYFSFQRHVRMFSEDLDTSKNAVVINSLLFGSGQAEKDSIIEHSELRGNWYVGERAFCSGVRSYYGVHIEKEIVLKEIKLIPGKDGADRRIVILFGVNDTIKAPFHNPASTYVNQPWSHFFALHEILPEEIWPHVPETSRTLWNARLFPIQNPNEWLDSVLWMQYNKKPSTLILRKWRNSPRFSFAEILLEADPGEEFEWIRTIAHKMDLHQIELTLLERKKPFFIAYFKPLR